MFLGYQFLMIQPGRLEVWGLQGPGGGGGVESILTFQRAQKPPEDPLATLLVGNPTG